MIIPSCLASSNISLARAGSAIGAGERPAPTPAAHATEFHPGMHGDRLRCPDQSLAKNQLLALPAQDLTLTCLSGELWLTRDGDIEDYILGPGQRFVVGRGDRATVQALQPSTVRLRAA